jgi:hypothetical protein
MALDLATIAMVRECQSNTPVTSRFVNTYIALYIFIRYTTFPGGVNHAFGYSGQLFPDRAAKLLRLSRSKAETAAASQALYATLQAIVAGRRIASFRPPSMETRKHQPSTISCRNRERETSTSRQAIGDKFLSDERKKIA